MDFNINKADEYLGKKVKANTGHENTGIIIGIVLGEKEGCMLYEDVRILVQHDKHFIGHNGNGMDERNVMYIGKIKSDNNNCWWWRPIYLNLMDSREEVKSKLLKVI